MKNVIFTIMALTLLFSIAGCGGKSNPEDWSKEKLDKWFDKGDWLNGWQVRPDMSVDRKAFSLSYYKDSERWNKAFTFLKENNLMNLELKRYDIDGDNAYATVSEYLTKNIEDARFEAHRKYIDIQYVIDGKEMIEVAPLSSKKIILEQYDPDRDIEFLTAGDSVSLQATPDRFFIFFPDDAHKPGLKAGENSTVRKIVVKVKTD
jgi:YhcH/YjgK/YiaL family protein